MTINGRRRFCFNGRKYYIANTLKADMKSEKDKYYICEVDQDGITQILYDSLGWEIRKFETVKEAQRFVRNWDWMLEKI